MSELLAVDPRTVILHALFTIQSQLKGSLLVVVRPDMANLDKAIDPAIEYLFETPHSRLISFTVTQEES